MKKMILKPNTKKKNEIEELKEKNSKLEKNGWNC